MLAIVNQLVANLKMTVRNKQALVWTFVMPVVLMLLFGMAFGGSETLVLKAGIVDEAKNDFSKQFVESLEKIEAFKVSRKSRGEELKALREGDRALVIILPKSFGEGAIKLIESKKKAEAMAKTAAETGAQPGDTRGAPEASATGAIAAPKVETSKLEVYIDKTNPSLAGTSRSMLNQIVLSMNQKVTGSPELFKIDERQISSRKYSNIDFFAAGILSMFIMNGGSVAVVMILVSYRERGILRRLMATPMSISSFIGSQIAVRVIIALMQMALLLAIAIWVFGAHVAGSPWLLSAIVVEGALVFIALGFAIASFANSDQTAMAVANIITMPMMFLSGVFFPTEMFPKFMQPLIKVLPLTYLSRALREVMMKGSGFEAVAKDMGILALFGIVIFLVSVRAFRWE
ncbi:MAG: ABC transporter permease [Actinobacteria bacterium]|nr:ABC transporter permease [Actinomycetota bacterium]